MSADKVKALNDITPSLGANAGVALQTNPRADLVQLLRDFESDLQSAHDCGDFRLTCQEFDKFVSVCNESFH